MKSVAKALLISGHKTLVLYRSKTHPSYAFQPDLPGGEVELDETPWMAVEREIEEETGIKLTVTESDLVYEKKTARNEQHLIFRLLLDQLNIKIILSWEHQSYEWVDLEKLINNTYPDNLDPFFKDVIDYLKSSSKNT